MSDSTILLRLERPGAELRLSLDRYAGKVFLNFRKWYQTGENFTPSKQGVTFHLDETDAVMDALQRAKSGEPGPATPDPDAPSTFDEDEIELGF